MNLCTALPMFLLHSISLALYLLSVWFCILFSLTIYTCKALKILTTLIFNGFREKPQWLSTHTFWTEYETNIRKNYLFHSHFFCLPLICLIWFPWFSVISFILWWWLFHKGPIFFQKLVTHTDLPFPFSHSTPFLFFDLIHSYLPSTSDHLFCYPQI